MNEDGLDTNTEGGEPEASGRKIPQNIEGSEKDVPSNYVSENERVYSDAGDDPAIKRTEEAILDLTNLDDDVIKSRKSGLGEDEELLNRTRGEISRKAWRHFVSVFPEKASAYAQSNTAIRDALRELERENTEDMGADDESKKIYAESHRDPMIRETEQRIVRNTDKDAREQSESADNSENYSKLWRRSFAFHKASEWGRFVRDYPEKAKAYAKTSGDIRAALEEFESKSATDQSAENNITESLLGTKTTGTGLPSISSIPDLIHTEPEPQITPQTPPVVDDHDQVDVVPDATPVAAVSDESDATLEVEDEIGLPRPEAIKRENQYMQEVTDTWGESGSFTVDDDILLYQPKVEDRPLREDEDRYEYRRKRSRRGFEITIETDQTGGKKVLSPMAWKILEMDASAQEKFKLTLPEENIVFSPDLFYKPMAGKAMYVWEKLNVDKNTLMMMQAQIVDYLKTEVRVGKLDEGLLKTARGILKVNEKMLMEKIKGLDKKPSIGPVKVESSFGFLKPDNWTINGKIERKDDELVYEDQKLKSEYQERRLEIGKRDPTDTSGEKKTLTDAAWAILKKIPKLPKNEETVAFHVDFEKTTDIPLIETYSRPYRSKAWQESVKAKYLTADLDTLIYIQAKIARYVEEQVANGLMDEEILDAVSGLLIYKYANLIPEGYTSFLQTEMKYKIKGNKIYKPVSAFKIIGSVFKE